MRGFIVESQDGRVEFSWGLQPPLGADVLAKIDLERTTACSKSLMGNSLQVVEHDDRRNDLDALKVLAVLDDPSHHLHDQVSQCVTKVSPQPVASTLRPLLSVRIWITDASDNMILEHAVNVPQDASPEEIASYVSSTVVNAIRQRSSPPLPTTTSHQQMPARAQRPQPITPDVQKASDQPAYNSRKGIAFLERHLPWVANLVHKILFRDSGS
jgi:hypothetical protein